jgi:hypothetical protein
MHTFFVAYCGVGISGQGSSAHGFFSEDGEVDLFKEAFIRSPTRTAGSAEKRVVGSSNMIQ